MDGIFILLALMCLVFFFVALIRPKSIKQIREGKITKKKALIGSVILVFVFLILVGVTAPQPSKTDPIAPSSAAPAITQNTDTGGASITPEELPLWITVDLRTLSTTGTLSASDASELAEIPPLTIQDEWNDSLGYYENLSPATATPLTDFQVTAILSAIQTLRKQHNEQGFSVMIFDDPTIAQEARSEATALANLPNDQYCKIFAHFRGDYDWNPTTQNEDVDIGGNCTWNSIQK